MKRFTIFARIFMLGAILMLVLSACEKPTPGAEQQQSAQETQAASQPVTQPETAVTQEAMPPAAVATTPPVDAPVDTAPPVDAPVATDTPMDAPADGDTAVAVDPTPVPEAGGDPATDPQAGGGTSVDVPAVTPVAAGGTYTVSAGENFFRIGLNHGCTVAQMAAVNSAVVPPNYIIYIGQELVIPTCR